METKQNVQEITLKQLIEQSANDLGEILVPTKYKEQIADPISRVIRNLNICVLAYSRFEAENKAQEAAKDSKDSKEPEIVIEETGSIPENEIPEDATVINLDGN